MAPASHPSLSAPSDGGPGDDLVPLSRAAVGCRGVVASVEGPARAELEREGVLPGSLVLVTGRTPLGGPVIVDLGRARLAVSANVAAQVLVRRAGSRGQIA